MPILTVGSKRILYVHVPKTGGTSVEELLLSYGGTLSSNSPTGGSLPCTPQHFHAELLNLVFGNSGDPYGRRHDFDFVFMTVRHPIARLLSEYRHQRTIHQSGWNSGRLAAAVAIKRLPVAQILSFDLWCNYALRRYSRNPYFSDNHLRPQVEFELWEPVVFRLEDGLDQLKQRLDSVTGGCGELPSEPRKFSIDRAGSVDCLRNRTRRMIHTQFGGDFLRYDYQLSPLRR